MGTGEGNKARSQHTTVIGPGNTKREDGAGVLTEITVPQGNVRMGWFLSM